MLGCATPVVTATTGVPAVAKMSTPSCWRIAAVALGAERAGDGLAAQPWNRERQRRQRALHQRVAAAAQQLRLHAEEIGAVCLDGQRQARRVGGDRGDAFGRLASLQAKEIHEQPALAERLERRFHRQGASALEREAIRHRRRLIGGEVARFAERQHDLDRRLERRAAAPSQSLPERRLVQARAAERFGVGLVRRRRTGEPGERSPGTRHAQREQGQGGHCRQGVGPGPSPEQFRAVSFSTAVSVRQGSNFDAGRRR